VKELYVSDGSENTFKAELKYSEADLSRSRWIAVSKKSRQKFIRTIFSVMIIHCFILLKLPLQR